MKNILRVFGYAKSWRKYLVASTIALFLMAGINLFSPYITKRIIAILETISESRISDFEQVGYADEQLNKIITLAALLAICFAARAFFRFVNNYFSHVASWQLVSRLRSTLYDHLQKLSMSYYQDKQTGQLMSNVVNDTSTFENMIAHAIPEIITNVITLTGVLVILFLINPFLTLLVCIPIPLIAFLSVTLRKIRRFFREGQAKIAELNAVLQDNFSGIKEIQIFNKQNTEYKRVKKKAGEHSNAIIKALFYSGILNPTVEFIMSLGTVVVLIAGSYLALKANLKVSDVVAFLLYLNILYAPITTLTRIIEDMQQALAGAERVFAVLDTEPDIKDIPGAKNVGHLSGQIEFKNVSFSYNDDVQVLDDISFEIKSGQMIAIVGPTGVGKSTISGLIARFYDPTSGIISMDGIDIKNLTLNSLRNQLSIVLQDVFLFNGTIAENIAYGCADASSSDSETAEKIKQAAKIGCIDEYISSLPEGYDTFIGERGVRLSGGQKQRISIARSILRDTPILLLDEATSSVDTETEREIQNAIDKIAGSRTLIVIAHRLSTIKKADIILVLQNGKIVERGNHEELIKHEGVYANLCKIQNLDFYDNI
ncbi:MAG: ABC transporter ATP-binding protein/permease [Eubacterium sp.]|jgi:ABC-type multidrug transport system fused ATPase/permease subunit|nr:ABC transporter ATP-binding protein/permease [Eubacterium sp.]